jgi:hypothetical protein
VVPLASPGQLGPAMAGQSPPIAVVRAVTLAHAEDGTRFRVLLDDRLGFRPIVVVGPAAPASPRR